MTVDANEDTMHLRERLAVFAKVMLGAFLVLRLAEFLLYRMYLGIWPNHYWTIFAIGGVSLAVLASAWYVLPRRALSAQALAAIDLSLMTACGTMFGLTAMLASNRPESAYTCLIYACFMVFMRTIVVPSSARRTLVVSAIAMLPLVVGSLYLALLTKQDALQMLLDLVIACSFAIGWMTHDAKKRGIKAWPYVAMTVVLGSIGVLVYAVRRGLTPR